MKTKWMLTVVAALALGVAVLNVTGCKKSETESTMPAHDAAANVDVPKNAPAAAPAPETNAAPPAMSTNAPAPETKVAAKQYTCPMHPEVVQDSPGKCPKCNMDLMEK